MIVGYILGIPITLIAIYFLILRPLINLGSDADPDSVVGKTFSAITWVFFALFVVFVVSALLLFLFFVAAAQP